jgi:hypothetical protein
MVKPDPTKCPGHAALVVSIEDMKKLRDEDKKEIKDHITLIVGNLETKVDWITTRIEMRLDKGDQKFQVHNGEIVSLKGWRQYVLGGMALVILLAPIVISLIALWK